MTRCIPTTLKPFTVNNQIRMRSKRKAKIHAALREQVWLRYAGPNFQFACATQWCQNEINCFNFQCGHIQAESKGGATTLENLTPLCARCNLSMGTMHMNAWNAMSGQSVQAVQVQAQAQAQAICQTIPDINSRSKKKKSLWYRFKSFFRPKK